MIQEFIWKEGVGLSCILCIMMATVNNVLLLKITKRMAIKYFKGSHHKGMNMKPYKCQLAHFGQYMCVIICENTHASYTYTFYTILYYTRVLFFSVHNFFKGLGCGSVTEPIPFASKL